jgi:hypothetical protein
LTIEDLEALAVNELERKYREQGESKSLRWEHPNDIAEFATCNISHYDIALRRKDSSESNG